mgnify:CR=1 FL=1
MAGYRLIMAALIVMAIIIATPLIGQSVSTSFNSFIMQLNNYINEALLSKCKITPSTIPIVGSSPLKVTNKMASFNLTLGNNYIVVITMRLANNQLPINEVNISVVNGNNTICYSNSISVNSTTGVYNYTVQKSNYFTMILSYSGPTPTVTNSSNSLVIYGTKINSVIVIPTMPVIMGNVICSTGSPSIPVYMVYVLGRPIMYVIQPPRPIKSILCRYSQSLSISYLLMAIIIGIAVALIYEAVVMIRISHLKIIQ